MYNVENKNLPPLSLVSVVLVVSCQQSVSIARVNVWTKPTQVEVVLKAVAKSHQAENQMPDC